MASFNKFNQFVEDVAEKVHADALVRNYGACRADAEQLSALEAWVRAQGEAGR